MLLFIPNKMFGARNDTGILDALDGLSHLDASQNGIRATGKI